MKIIEIFSLVIEQVANEDETSHEKETGKNVTRPTSTGSGCIESRENELPIDRYKVIETDYSD